MTSLNRDVAWVTGSGRGIGRAIALAFARAGARVIVSARSIDEVSRVGDEIRAAGAEAVAIGCDVTSANEVQAAVAAAIDRFEHVDILVNNAGFVESVPLVRLEPSLWDRTLDVNLTGTYRCTRSVLPAMVRQGYGRIINIASTAARVGYKYTTAYCAAKHGVLGFTRALALEVASNGITVNALCPGWVDTDMTKAGVRRIVEKTGRSAEEARQMLAAMNPQRRLIRPEEVAAVALFLARREAAAITGQAYGVDGGEVMA
jgi:NAD(P)-dependent dehydrogenase (short-subunit alcohol dehydrogenase family)